MRRYHLAGSIGLILLLILIMGTACGKAEDGYVLGIDGYVYVAQPLSWWSELTTYRQENDYPSWGYDFQLVGASLYYQYYTGEKTVQRKTSAKSPSWTEGESIPYHDSDADDPSSPYIVDEEGNFYYQEWEYGYDIERSADGTVTITQRLDSVILYKQTSEGKLLWQLDFSGEITEQATRDMYNMALYPGDRVLVLLGDTIYIVDESGEMEGSIPIEEYNMGDAGTRRLIGSLDGSVYYVINMKVYEVVNEDRWDLVRVGAFTGISYGGGLYPGRKGLLFSSQDGYLYEYEKGASSLKPILKWEDSNLFYSYVRGVFPLSEEQLLVVTEKDDYMSSSEIEQNMYLLERMPVEELPDQEVIVLASLMPFPELELAVAEFNLQSTQYHVTLETYGGISDLTAASARLDAAVVSKNPPDILDLSGLDIYKYTNKGVLEDLNEYLEGSSLVRREDYLEGVIEGYTINGKLVSIPRGFYFMTVMGRRELFGDRVGWTMEECMELTEQYPEYSLVNGRDASWILRYLCSGYFLERFVDWEAGSSSFDSAEFCELLEWLKACGEGRNGDPFTLEDALLVIHMSITSLLDRFAWENFIGKELTMIGFPSVDGSERHEVIAEDVLGIVSASGHKEGAWAFLEFFLGTEQNASYNAFFPTNQKRLQNVIEYYTTPPEYELDENGEPIVQWDGSYKVVEGTPYKIFIFEEPLYYLEEERIADVLQAIGSLDFTPGREGERAIVNIVEEEAAEYFSGNKGIGEVVDIIQNRVQLLLSEGM